MNEITNTEIKEVTKLIKYTTPSGEKTLKVASTPYPYATPTYGGKQAGVIVLDKSGEIKEREGGLIFLLK